MIPCLMTKFHSPTLLAGTVNIFGLFDDVSEYTWVPVVTRSPGGKRKIGEPLESFTVILRWQGWLTENA